MARLSRKNILITGLPGSGKTTLIRKLSHELREYDTAGFITAEIRAQGKRRGFQLASLDGRKTGTLAHVDITGPHRVGKYGVDLKGLERFLDALRLVDQRPRLVMIDEIGKMECISEIFRALVVALLDAPAPVIATVALKAGGFIEEVKRRPDVQIYEVFERNRDALLRDIACLVRSSILPLDQPTTRLKYSSVNCNFIGVFTVCLYSPPEFKLFPCPENLAASCRNPRSPMNHCYYYRSPTPQTATGMRSLLDSPRLLSGCRASIPPFSMSCQDHTSSLSLRSLSSLAPGPSHTQDPPDSRSRS